MVKTVNLSTDIPPNHELHITLPADIPSGPADILLVVSSPVPRGASTLGELADSEFFGIWRDRPDITDSAQFAHDLRSKGWERTV
jgi:hypothetical protein